MSHAKNKVKWCLKNAERGLLKVKEDVGEAREHIKKAEHDLKATIYLKKSGFSDWGGSTAFYSVYHSLLAILSKFGYESRNQECTFAMIYNLIEDNKIDLDKSIIEKVSVLNRKEGAGTATIIDIREQCQYGTQLSLKDETYEEILEIAKRILGKAKEIIEE